MGTPIDTYNKIITTVNSVTSDYSFDVDPQNLIVIDTSNNRIGIDNVNPIRSIHINGDHLTDATTGIITPYIHLTNGQDLNEITYGGNFKGSIIPDIKFVDTWNGVTGTGVQKFYRTTHNVIDEPASGYNLGLESHRWRELWSVSADVIHMNIRGESLYIEGKKVISKNYSNGNIVIGNQTQEVELNTTFTDISLTGSVNLITNTGISHINSTGNIVIDPSGVGNKTGIVTINGDLVVLGEQNIINSNVVEISDNIIKLNKNYQSNFHSNFKSGIIIEDGSSNNPQLVWVNNENIWKFIRNNSNQLLDLELSNLNITTFINFFNNNILTAKITSQKNNLIDTLILEATNVEISNNSALIIPVGTTAQRNNPPRLGSIRFNSNDVAFEGYDGNAWGTLGGVKNVAKSTYIRAETFPDSRNNELDFFTDHNQRMQIGNTGILKYGTNLPSQYNLEINNGNFKFGSSMSDTTLEINNTQLTSKNIIPKTNQTYDIGSSTNKWNNMYAEYVESTDGRIHNILNVKTIDNIQTIYFNPDSGNGYDNAILLNGRKIIGGDIGTDNANDSNVKNGYFKTLKGFDGIHTNGNLNCNQIWARGDIYLNNNLFISTNGTFYGNLIGKANTAGTADVTNTLHSSGSYSCNQLTASLIGNVTGNVTGGASYASYLNSNGHNINVRNQSGTPRLVSDNNTDDVQVSYSNSTDSAYRLYRDGFSVRVEKLNNNHPCLYVQGNDFGSFIDRVHVWYSSYSGSAYALDANRDYECRTLKANLDGNSNSTSSLDANTDYTCSSIIAENVYGGRLWTKLQQSDTQYIHGAWYYAAYFTGSHGNNNNFNFNVNIDYNGLIVSCIDKYVNINYSIKPTISESLPVTKLTNIEKDKAVFGVIAYQETMKESTNKFKVNSLGEGAIWITNKNGNLEIGDYITSSVIPGYGQKQDDDLLHNYTVAKITCNCDFSLEKKIKQKIITISNENYSGEEYKPINESYETLYKEFISYDENGEIQYEDDLDLSGNQIYEYKFDTRFLDESGNLLNSLADYLIKLNNGENVYIACFVGCTYHCG